MLNFRPGIRESIVSARETGLAAAIASSSPRSWVRGHLERVDAIDLFDLIVTGDEVANHKPDPAVYTLALRRLGVPGRGDPESVRGSGRRGHGRPGSGQC